MKRFVITLILLSVLAIRAHEADAQPNPIRATARRITTLPPKDNFLPPEPVVRRWHVKKGGWRTLETFWNAKATIVIRGPKGAEVKIRYGVIFGKDSQKKKLDGSRPVKLTVGTASLVRARFQIRVPFDTDIAYYVYPGKIKTFKKKF